MVTDYYSSKSPVEIEFPVKEFHKIPGDSRCLISGHWTFCQSFYDASQSTEASVASFSQDNKTKRKIETGIQASIVFLSLRVSYCSVPLDISASFDSPELCLCWVLLARVMPKRQRILESFRALCVGLWQGSTWLNKKQPDAVSPRWICNNLGGSNFLGDWHNYTQTNCLNRHIFINMRLKLSSLSKPGEQQHKPKGRNVGNLSDIPHQSWERARVRSSLQFGPVRTQLYFLVYCWHHWISTLRICISYLISV